MKLVGCWVVLWLYFLCGPSEVLCCLISSSVPLSRRRHCGRRHSRGTWTRASLWDTSTRARAQLLPTSQHTHTHNLTHIHTHTPPRHTAATDTHYTLTVENSRESSHTHSRFSNRWVSFQTGRTLQIWCLFFFFNKVIFFVFSKSLLIKCILNT